MGVMVAMVVASSWPLTALLTPWWITDTNGSTGLKTDSPERVEIAPDKVVRTWS